MNKGLLYAVITYSLWGLFPIYWKWIQAVPALEILGHRTVWSLLFLLIILTIQRHWLWVRRVIHDCKTVLTFITTSLLLAINWITYIWAVNAGYIIETSLGYFINPLVSVLLGMLFLQERMRLGQWIAVGIAGLGVLYLTVSYGALPWIGLTLAFSFGIYGLLRKTAALSSIEGLSLETAILAPVAFGYLLYLELIGVAAFGYTDIQTHLLLVFSGVVTAVPLLTFATAARLIPLSTIGILQYIAPSTQFLLGVFVYAEPFSQDRLVGFSLIWMALLIYSAEGIVQRRRATKLQYAN